MLRNFNYFIVLMMSLSAMFSSAQASNDIAADNAKRMTQCRATEQTPMTVDELAPSIAEQHFQLLGSAKFSVLFWDIYQSILLTTDGQPPFSHTCQHALFEIHYLRDISKAELLENTLSQWRHLALDEDDYIEFLPLLAGIWPDIKAGDQLSMLSQANSTTFYLNRHRIGVIDSATFAQLFLAIWLDENTSEPKLRQQLLGELI